MHSVFNDRKSQKNTKKRVMVTKSPSLDFEQGLSRDSYECDNEILVSLKIENFLSM